MFFKTKDTIAEGLGFNTFGIVHLAWLTVLIAVCILSVIFYRRQSLKVRSIIRKVLCSAIIATEALKDIVLIAIGEFSVGYLPFHLCGINILLIAFDMFKATETVRSFLYYFCIPGALLALLFPNWTTLPFFNFFHINSFVIHILLLLYPILLLSTGEIKPTLKAMPKSLCLLLGMAVPIYFINLAFDTNFMFLMQPDSGNPLEVFEKLLGNHLWGFVILLPLVMGIMYLPIFITEKKKIHKK